MQTEVTQPLGRIQNLNYSPPLQKAVKYCLYARKSSEDDERQALSIDSQIKEMLALAEKEGLEVVEIRKEAHSAKESGTRPIFKQLLDDIGRGMFDGILTWAPDRLSRNAGDLGRIVDFMDQGMLTNIKTHGQQFSNNPNEKFLLMNLCSQAKLENDNKSINVKRGLRTKCEMGIRPGCVPLGYKLIRNSENLREASTIVVDEERAPFVKKMFEYVNSGLSGHQVNEYLTDEGFRTKSGKPVALSMTYRIFKETFYYGEFEYPKGSGNLYKGAHTPLISKEEFIEANKRLEVPAKGLWGRKEFYFKKLFKCGHCGSGISAEEKVNRYGTLYTYYKCNRMSRSRCRSKYISETKLIESIAKMVVQIKGDHLHLERKLAKEIEKFTELQKIATGKETGITITTEAYLQYILKNGSNQEKRSILEYLGQLYLKDGEVKTDEGASAI
jgi:DNA invertase Pin-like site-specific DNA recombinase